MRLASHDPFRATRIRAPQLGDQTTVRPLHVHAHVDRYPPFVNAGGEWMLHALLRDLVEHGHTVTVSTLIEHPAIVDGVTVWPADFATDLATDCDVMVGHLLWTGEAVRHAARAGKPILYLVHNDAQLHYWRLAPGDITATVFNSDWVRAAYPRWSGDSVVVRPPTLLRDYQLERNPGAAEYVTLVNPNAEKGAGLFYEVARRMPQRRFLVVGGGYGLQMPVPPGVRNVTYQPPTGRIVQDVYARTRLLLVPSLYESWGRVATEAIASGIPVVAHPTPGLREALDGGAMFADRGDVDEWCRLVDLLDNPEIYQEWSILARCRAAELDDLAVADLATWRTLVARAGAAVLPDGHQTAPGAPRRVPQARPVLAPTGPTQGN